MKKKTLYSEAAYIIGLLILALGTAFIEKANFGLSMIVAPAYLIHLKVSQLFPFFTFGMAEYCFQGLLIIILTIVLRKFRLNYLFSFITAVIYGFLLDGCMFLVQFIAADEIALRIAWYVVGVFLCTLGIALLFNTYISPEAYELLVKKISSTFGFQMYKVKFIYDISSLMLAIALSWIFFGFGSFESMGIGTVICALVNGKLIGVWSDALQESIEFKDLLKLRPFFEKG